MESDCVTDGPFAETREQLGGFRSMQDEAISIAGRIPGVRKGTVEIRLLETIRLAIRAVGC